jgi:hypothetical protein
LGVRLPKHPNPALTPKANLSRAPQILADIDDAGEVRRVRDSRAGSPRQFRHGLRLTSLPALHEFLIAFRINVELYSDRIIDPSKRTPRCDPLGRVIALIVRKIAV